MTRPLASAKVEATGKSYSDHEALEVDLELSISDDKKSNTASENKERVSCKKTTWNIGPVQLVFTKRFFCI